ncbi:MAG: glucokinase [Betaproteobacteria bacterium]|nr:MAG: glucokinase [Betaproteobacteria bacterium]
MKSPICIIADIGGTNARFALVEPTESGVASFSAPEKYLTADRSFSQTVSQFIRSRGIDFNADIELRAAVAAPVSAAQSLGEHATRLTNCDWEIGLTELHSALPKLKMRVLNDFAAVALALPSLTDAELTAWASTGSVSTGPKLAIGPGTGLGVASIVCVNGAWHVVPGEGGHVTLSAADDREAAILSIVRREFPHVSAERLLSGTGLPTLHRAVCAVDGLHSVASSAEDITDAVHRGELGALATLKTFAAMLGSVAGNAALTLGATGGVYLAGGLLQHWRDVFPVHDFVTQFRSKGRFTSYLTNIAIHRIDAPEPGLIGLARSA